MKKQRDDERDDGMESFTIRIPAWLKGNLGRIRGSMTGVNTLSDAARLALEVGSNNFDSSSDAKELWKLNSDESEALKKIVSKWKQNKQLLNRSELAFLAQEAHHSFVIAKTSNVKKGPIESNIRAFAALRLLREELYKNNDKSEHRDSYYHGNLGNSGGGTIENRLDEVIRELAECPPLGQSEFASRCLEVALRDEPLLPIDKLNEVLRPAVPSLLKLAIRNTHTNKAKPISNEDSSFTANLAKQPKPVTCGRIRIDPIIHGDSFTAGINWLKGNIIVSINNFIEFTDLLTLTTAAKYSDHVFNSRFTIFRTPFEKSEYFMRVGGVQILFVESEFSDLCEALSVLMQQQEMVEEYERLSWIYGEI